MTASRNILKKYTYWTDGTGNVYREHNNSVEICNPNNRAFQWIYIDAHIGTHWSEIGRAEVSTHRTFNPPRYIYTKLGKDIIRSRADYTDIRMLIIDDNGRARWKRTTVREAEIRGRKELTRKQLGAYVKVRRNAKFAKPYQRRLQLGGA